MHTILILWLNVPCASTFHAAQVVSVGPDLPQGTNPGAGTTGLTLKLHLSLGGRTRDGHFHVAL